VVADTVLLGYGPTSMGDRFPTFRRKKDIVIETFGPRKMKAPHSFEISESDYPLMQPRIPRERNPH